MKQRLRNPPTFCIDCGTPISAEATRCRRCAASARGLAGLSQANGVQITDLAHEDRDWIRSNSDHIDPESMARMFRVTPGIIASILRDVATD